MNLPEEEVNIRVAKCGKCKKVLLTAVEHMMSKEGKKELADCAKDGCDISTIPLLEYRKLELEWCDRDICYPKIKKSK